MRIPNPDRVLHLEDGTWIIEWQSDDQPCVISELEIDGDSVELMVRVAGEEAEFPFSITAPKALPD